MDANKQIVPVSGVVSSNSQEEGEPSVDQSSESAVVVAPPPSPATPPAQNYQVVIPDHDREYGCPFCKKKFSNKQALGGHQNAHKVERLMVKNLQEQRNNSLDYLRSSSHSRYGAGGPSFTSYKYRYSPYSFGCTAHHHSSGCPGVIPYSSRPLLPPSGAFPGWPAPNPAPTMGPFPGSIQYTIPFQNINIVLPNFEAGTSSNAGAGTGAGAGAGAGQGSPAGGAINLRNVPEPEEDDDSDIDLSLKLSYN